MLLGRSEQGDLGIARVSSAIKDMQSVKIIIYNMLLDATIFSPSKSCRLTLARMLAV